MIYIEDLLKLEPNRKRYDFICSEFIELDPKKKDLKRVRELGLNFRLRYDKIEPFNIDDVLLEKSQLKIEFKNVKP